MCSNLEIHIIDKIKKNNFNEIINIIIFIITNFYSKDFVIIQS